MLDRDPHRNGAEITAWAGGTHVRALEAAAGPSPTPAQGNAPAPFPESGRALLQAASPSACRRFDKPRRGGWRDRGHCPCAAMVECECSV
jgi:hypothetical protein